MLKQADNNNHRIKRKGLYLGVILFFILITPLILFFLIQSPAVINHLGKVFKDIIGFNISVSDISLSPSLKGEIKSLHITPSNDKNIALYISHVEIQGSIGKYFQGEIKKAVIKEPRLSLVAIKGDKKIDLSFLNKLPPIEFLDITKGEITFFLNSEGQIIKLKDISMNLKDFSPQKGGKIYIRSQIKMKKKSDAKEEDLGYGEGIFDLSKFLPIPVGKGYIRLNINNMDLGSTNLKNLALNISFDMKTEEIIMRSLSPLTGSIKYTSEDKDIFFKDIQLNLFAKYDINKKELDGGIRDSKLDNLGNFDINIQSIINQDYPWKASIKASSINFEKASEIFKLFLPAQYSKWSSQGSGAMEATMEGNYKDKILSGTGKLMLEFKEGGISAPDSDKAAQGLTGRLKMDIQIPTSGKKGQFDISSEMSLGEFLWEKYYKDFSGKKVFFRSRGNIYDSSFKSIDLTGSFDLAEAGNYSYSASLKGYEWVFQLDSEEINLEGLFSLIIREHLTHNNPSFIDFHLSGISQLEMALKGSADEFTSSGILKIKDFQAIIPDKLLISADLNLPFDLFYPYLSSTPALIDDIKLGNLYIKELRAASFKIEDINIPILLTKNNLSIPNALDIPFSGTTLKLVNFKGENILSSDRLFKLGMFFSDLELGAHLEKIADVNIPAKLYAELPKIIYKNGELNTEGKLRVEIFGGIAEIDNIHGRKLFANSRVLGGDIIFEKINLNELTNYINLGRMSGIISGTMRGFEIEYGQPSRFVLDIESVKTKGIDQSISVDAIDNISIMGSGAGMGTVLKSGLAKFFKHYKYSRIGILCILENDVFTIRGKIHEGGREYLIRRGFLSGIDVINQNPENNISFKDMRERISRIFDKKLKNSEALN